MKLHVLSVLGGCALLLSHQVVAQTHKEADYIDRLSEKTQQLEQELAQLRAELAQVKLQQQQQQQSKQQQQQPKQQQPSPQSQQPKQQPSQPSQTPRQPGFIQALTAGGTPPYEPLRGEPAEWESLGPYYELSPDDELKIVTAPDVYPEDIAKTLTSIGGIPVVTSRYFGERAAYDGSDLIVNLPFANQDLRLLEQKQKIENYLLSKGLPLPEQPVVDLSGDIELLSFVQKPFTGKTTGTFDFADVELDVLAQFNRWATGFIAFEVDPERPTTGGPSTANSRTFLSRGFVTLGNLNFTPLYLTAGQIFVPFGRYSSSLVSTTLPRNLGRTKSRAVILGFKQPGEHGFFASAYGFRGDARKSPGTSGIAGGNAGFTFRKNDFGGEIGAGLISSLAESQFMQNTNGSCSAEQPTCFLGFGINGDTERLRTRVPGLNVNVALYLYEYAIVAEWVAATRPFNSQDLFFGHVDRGAKPSAFNLEFVRRFEVITLPASFALGWANTRQAAALLFPRNRYTAAFNISPMRNTILGLEARYDRNYQAGTIAGGLSALPGGGAVSAFAPGAAGFGHSSVTFSALFGAYF